MRIGFFQTEAVFLIYIIQAFMVVSAYLLRYHSEWLILGLYLVFSSVIVTVFYLACNRDWKMPRSHFIDNVVKMRLKKLKESGFFIRIIFKPVEIGITLLLILLCFVSTQPPVYLSISSAFAVVVFSLVWFFKREWAKRLLLLLLYLFIPFMIYLSETNNESWINQMNETVLNAYNLSFFVLGGLGLLVLRVTRRRNGFRVTPMDFLVLFVAVGIFFLPELWAGFRLSAIKTIILFFTYEIIMGESRDKIGTVALSAVIAFSIVAVRGLL
jgi:UDP-GlcNAc:undecaprenyl-phosphate GlcNAc-1-phosphate transferase